MEKILTVTVPSYNVEKFLDKCLTSFFFDNPLFGKLEVIVVNDGSSDSTPEIAQKYVDLYPNVFKLINKENGGHGSTINCGIKNAVGKYFKVVDSDDWVDTKNFYKLMEVLYDIDSDIVLSPFVSVDECTGHTKKYSYNTAGIEVGKECMMEDFIRNREIKMHTITYKTSILKKNKIRIDEKCFYVDTEYVYFPLKYVKTCFLFNKPIYMYRTNQTNQSCSNQGFIKHKRDHAKVTLRLSRYLARYGDDMPNSMRMSAERFITNMVIQQYKIYLIEKPYSVCNRKNVKRFDEVLKESNLRIYKETEKEMFVYKMRESGFEKWVIIKLIFAIWLKRGLVEGMYN